MKRVRKRQVGSLTALANEIGHDEPEEFNQVNIQIENSGRRLN